MASSDYVPLHAATLTRDAVLAFESLVYGETQRLEDFGDADLPFPRDRAFGFAPAGEPSRIVAFCSSYAFGHTSVPGGVMSSAGLTWVGVDPGHRRRGLLTAMIGEHLRRCAARGEALSVLFAAEQTIYGRFGYAPGAQAVSLTVPRRAALREVPGAERCRVRIEAASSVRHGALVSRVRREAARPKPTGLQRPGWIYDSPRALEAWDWIDGAAFPDGVEHPRMIAIVEGEGEGEGAGSPRAFATFRRRPRREEGLARGEVRVGEYAAADPAAARALWGALTDIDLMAATRVSRLALDDPLRALLVDERAARPRVGDNLWVRLVDVPRALAARRYQADLDLVLQVADAQVPSNAGRWRVRARAFGEADVRRTDAPPDLMVDQCALAGAFLGGPSLAALAQATGARETTPGALARCAAAFGWPVAPVCPRPF